MTRLFDESFLRRLERLALIARHTSAGQMQGERRSPKRGQSVEFSDFRPYTTGDDFRRIDWNAYARLERFFIKLFVEEEDLAVHLLVDGSRSMNWGEPNKLAYAVRVAGFGRHSQGNVVLGIRAEDMQVTTPSQGQIRGEVFSFELLGDSTTVTIKVADGFITARADKDFRASMGDQVGFSVPSDRCYLFDGQTQNRMRLDVA